MFNKNGKSTFFVVLVTAIITMLFCYVVAKFSLYAEILNNGDFISQENGGTTAFSKLKRVKRIVESSYLNEYDEKEMLDWAIIGMLQSLDDPYATYYNEDAFDSFMTQTEGEYKGIGIYVSFDTEKNMPIIITPIDGSPAAKADILPGDYIVYVDDLTAESSTYNELIDKIKGPIGTTVKVGLRRYSESGDYRDFEQVVERQEVEINPIIEKVYENNIGYIKLQSFDGVSYEEFEDKLNDLIDNKKIKGLILDLRNNTGGVLTVCTNITDLLVPEGKIVYTVNREGKEEVIYSDKNKIEIPLVVLVNGSSASASEVLTGAVKDYGVGKVVGTKTYGKGVVQTLKSLGDGTYIKLTTSEYFSPKGNKIQGLGITPDIVVELPEDVENAYNPAFEEDTQLQTAISEIKKMMER